MYNTLVFLPLIGFLIVGLFGRTLGDWVSQVLTSLLVTVSAILSWIVFNDVALGDGTAQTVHVLSWVTSGELSFNWAFKIDTLTAVMLVVVNSVSALVH